MGRDSYCRKRRGLSFLAITLRKTGEVLHRNTVLKSFLSDNRSCNKVPG